MKKFIWFFIFIITVGVGDRLLSSVCQSLLSQSHFRFSQAYFSSTQVDILTFGNSRGLSILSKDIQKKIKKNIRNLSYNGMPINLGKILIGDIIDKKKTVSKLIIEVTVADRFNTPVIKEFHAFLPESNRLQAFYQDSFPQLKNGGDIFHLLRYNNQIFLRSLNYIRRPDADMNIDRVISPKFIQALKDMKTYTITLSPYLLQELKETIKYAEDKGIEVVLYVAPYHPQFLEITTNLKDYIQFIEQGTNHKVYDYSNFLTDDHFFADGQHLNAIGGQKLDEQMLKDGIF